MRALLGCSALVLALALAPAAEARCVSQWRPAPPAVAKKRCKKASPATARAATPMVAAGLRGLATPSPDPTPSPAPGTDPTPSPPENRLGVVAREWSLTLSRTTLPSGAATVQLQNFGEDAHNLRIERVDGSGTPFDVPEAESGERKSATATLSPGDYKLYCALPGHEAQGMRARLTVTQ